MSLLGQHARDSLTGLEGIVIGEAKYLFGSPQYGLLPPAVNGSMQEIVWLEQERLEPMNTSREAR